MTDNKKLPLKRVELSLTKFNEVAAPHHLNLLRQHRSNILKFEREGDYGRVRVEQTNARRVVAQLRTLLHEVECLRAQLQESDLPAFDKLIQKTRDDTLAAIVDYLGMIAQSCTNMADHRRRETSPLSINREHGEAESESRAAASVTSTESVGVLRVDTAEESPRIQLVIEEQEATIRSREAVLRGWADVQRDVHSLHEAWQLLQGQAERQRETVELVASNVATADENVAVGRQNLSMAERLSCTKYGVGGAALGALVGGPLGALAGLKIGAIAALAGSAVGYFGARKLSHKRQEQIDDERKTQ